MTKLLVQVHGPDHAGIVAAVTRVLSDQDCNLEDTSMTRLGGQFTMLLTVDSHGGIAPKVLEGALKRTIPQSLDCVVQPIADKPANETVGEQWAISIYGQDKRGIVAAFADYLADQEVNIDDLSTRLVGDNYTVLIDVTVPMSVDLDTFVRELEELASELGVTAHARSVDADTL